MRYLKFFFKFLGYVLLIPILYILISLLLTYIPIAEKESDEIKNKLIYLTTNGVHSDIVLPREYIAPSLLKDLHFRPQDTHFAFGWGEENFYLNTPTWGELKFSTAFRAAFLKSKTLIHLTRYTAVREDWVEVPLSDQQLELLGNYILNSFEIDNSKKTRLDVEGYTPQRDDFYRANGNYMFYKTCNSWVNTALKDSKMKACLWTPFDFGAMRQYED